MFPHEDLTFAEEEMLGRLVGDCLKKKAPDYPASLFSARRFLCSLQGWSFAFALRASAVQKLLRHPD
jgi:hypothetical protein